MAVVRPSAALAPVKPARQHLAEAPADRRGYVVKSHLNPFIDIK